MVIDSFDINTPIAILCFLSFIVGIMSLFLVVGKIKKLYELKLNFYTTQGTNNMTKEELIKQEIDVYQCFLNNSLFAMFGMFSGYWVFIYNNIEPFRMMLLSLGVGFFVLFVLIIAYLLFLLYKLKKLSRK